MGVCVTFLVEADCRDAAASIARPIPEDRSPEIRPILILVNIMILKLRSETVQLRFHGFSLRLSSLPMSLSIVKPMTGTATKFVSESQKMNTIEDNEENLTEASFFIRA